MMTKTRKLVLATAMLASALASAAPAQAHGRWGYRRGGGGDAVAAGVIGGVIGLIVGAAVASSNNRPRQQVVYNDPYAYRISPEWQWRDGWYWDRYGNRYYRDGRPCENNGYGYGGGYNNRAYDNRNYNYGNGNYDNRNYGSDYTNQGGYQGDYRGRRGY